MLLIAAVVRGGLLLADHDALTEDPDLYRQLAENLRATGTFGFVYETDDGSRVVRPTAFRPPLYPLLLATAAWDGRVTVARVALLHWLLGLLTVTAVFQVGRRCLGAWSWLPALLVACDPILLAQTTQVMTETLAAGLAAAAIWSLDRVAWRATPARAALAGALMGLCILCRPTFLLWLLLVPGLLLMQRRFLAWVSTSGRQTADASPRSGDSAMPDRQHGPREAVADRGWSLACVAWLAFGAALTLAPWALRNAVVLNRFKLTTTHGGYTLLLGNNPSFYSSLNSPSTMPWDAAPLGQAWERRLTTAGPEDPAWNDLQALAERPRPQSGPLPSEFEADAFAYALARVYIRRHPGDFARSTWHRLKRFWGWLPAPRSAEESLGERWLRSLIGVYYLAVCLFAAAGLWCRRRELLGSPWLWGLALCLSFTVAHAFFWSNMRMRAPCIPVVSLLVAAGLRRAVEAVPRPK